MYHGVSEAVALSSGERRENVSAEAWAQRHKRTMSEGDIGCRAAHMCKKHVGRKLFERRKINPTITHRRLALARDNTGTRAMDWTYWRSISNGTL